MDKSRFDPPPGNTRRPGRTATPLEGHGAQKALPERRLLYTQVHSLLQKRILDGALVDGAFLPNEFDLSREFQVSIGTIRKAVDLLVEDDLVIRQQGRGTIVTDRRWSKSRERANRFRTADGKPIEEWRVEEIDYAKTTVPQPVATRLELAKGEEVHCIHRRRIAEPFWTISEQLFIPAAAIEADELEPLERRSFAALVRRHSLLIGAIDERITVATIDGPAAHVLALDRVTAVLRVERVLYDRDGKAFEFRLTQALPSNGAYWLSSS